MNILPKYNRLCHLYIKICINIKKFKLIIMSHPVLGLYIEIITMSLNVKAHIFIINITYLMFE